MEYRTLLVDSSYLAYREYFSSKLLPLAYGVLTRLMDLSKQYSVDTLIVALDRGHEAKDRIYDQYKSRRKTLSEEQRHDFNEQVSLLDDLLTHLGVKRCFAEGAEADDVIAHLVVHGNARLLGHNGQRTGCEVHAPRPILILSGDHDLYPLLSKEVTMWKARNRLYTVANFEEEFPSLKPSQYKDILALMGCSSDNVPGVRGIGPKYAVYLVQKYGSIGGIKNASDSDSVALRVQNSWDAVELSCRLVAYEEVDPVVKVGKTNLSKVRKHLFASGLSSLVADWSDLASLSKL